MLSQQDDMLVVGEANSGLEAVDLWRKLRPRVVLFDVEMPGLSGIEAFAKIRTECSETAGVILTVFQSEEDIFRAVEVGVAAYLVKDTPRIELLQIIRRVAAGEKIIDPRMAQKLADRISNGILSDREIEVLQLVAKGKANKEIAGILFISEGTVKAHMKSIFHKLDAMSRTEAVNKAVQRGIIRIC